MKKKMKKILAVCLAVILTGINPADFGVVRASTESEKVLVLTGTINIKQNGYQINQEKPQSYIGIYEITSEGTSVTNGSIYIQSGKHEIILNSVNIDLTGEADENVPICVESGCEVIFYLKGKSNINVNGDVPGIYVKNGAKAEFRAWREDSAANAGHASESCNAEGNGDAENGILNVNAQNGAAIGGAAASGETYDSGGTIEIYSGEYKLFSESGAAIGSGLCADFDGNIRIYGGNIKANEGRDIPNGGEGGMGGNEKKTLGRAGDPGKNGFGGIGAGGGNGGAEGEEGIYENQPGNGDSGGDGGDMNGTISIYGGYIETATIGGGNAGSGGGGGSTGYVGEGKDPDITKFTANGSGGDGGTGGSNNGTIAIYGGQIKAPVIGGGNGGNGGGTGGIWYLIANGEGVMGGMGGSSGYTYSGDGADGEKVLENKLYKAGTAGKGGNGGTIIINGGEIYDAVKIGGYDSEIARNAGIIYEENEYQTYDCKMLNPRMVSKKVLTEITIPKDITANSIIQISEPFKTDTSISADGTIILWLEENCYDIILTADGTSFYATDYDVSFDKINYITVKPCGNIDLSEISATIGATGYGDGKGNFIPFVSSEDKPYSVSGISEDNVLCVNEEGKYYFDLKDVSAGSINTPFLSLENSPEIFLTTDGECTLRGIRGSGTVTLSSDTTYEIRDIDSSVTIKDSKGNLRYGTKILTPWQNTEVSLFYNGTEATIRTDSEGALYPLMLKGEGQPVLIECGTVSLGGNIDITENNQNSSNTVNEYDFKDRELSKEFYTFTEDLRNRELSYSYDETTYFTTTIGSKNGLFLYGVNKENLKRLWIIKEGTNYLCDINSERQITINYDDPSGGNDSDENQTGGSGSEGSSTGGSSSSNGGGSTGGSGSSNGGGSTGSSSSSNGGGSTGGSGSSNGGGSTGGSGSSNGGGSIGSSSGSSTGGSSTGSSNSGSTGGSGGSGGENSGKKPVHVISAATLIRLDGIVNYDTNDLNTIKSWQTYRGIIKSTEKVEIYDKGNWTNQVKVHGKLTSKKENGTEVFFISDYTLKVRDTDTKQEYMICIDEVVVDPVAPEISLKGNKLKINKKDSVSYKKTFKNKLSVRLETDFSFSGKDGLYYKVVEKGKNVNRIKWKKVKNNKITLKKPIKACIYIKAVDKLGKETTVRTQGFEIK